MGVDEKAIAKGHRYMTLVCDLEEATVEYIGEERKQASLAAYFEAFPVADREVIDAISLDMWPAYINACQANVPGADEKMVFDRFHIMRHVRGGGQSQKAGAQGVAESRRRHPCSQQIPVADQPGEHAGAVQGTLQCTEDDGAENSSSLGLEGGAAGAVELPHHRLRHTLLEALVLLGDP